MDINIQNAVLDDMHLDQSNNAQKRFCLFCGMQCKRHKTVNRHPAGLKDQFVLFCSTTRVANSCPRAERNPLSNVMKTFATLRSPCNID